ncbi:hypothetical protein Cadr_000022536 [Camelus dromedarius]|uniref:Uncharacterized protein n=1 Tax=Camelus dromedarius TaxID=9838 RepID=A0A5N4CGD3_CAMDR|nr:hypothetical protein Cadr_000022536 [Camelus dromedarius]
MRSLDLTSAPLPVRLPNFIAQASPAGSLSSTPPPAPPYLPSSSSRAEGKRRPRPQAVFLFQELIQEQPAPASFHAFWAGSGVCTSVRLRVRAPPPPACSANCSGGSPALPDLATGAGKSQVGALLLVLPGLHPQCPHPATDWVLALN